jgi:ABC-2 type transport system ATP-binding protein
MNALPGASQSSRRFESMQSIVFDSVSKAFRHRPALFNWMGREREGETQALNDLSLSIAPGRILVLLGPNGSGKTTTLKLISTMLLPDSGRVLVEGSDTRREGDRVRRHVGFAVSTERSFFSRLSARENLDFFATLDDVPRHERKDKIDQVIGLTGLIEAADTLVMKFSTGMYQRLGMARALIKKPSVVLLDEPTRSLDPGSAIRFWETVRELPDLGSTVILATHSFSEAAAVGDLVAVLYRGTLAGSLLLSTNTGIDDLRDFYFRTTGEFEEVPETAVGGRC